MRLTRQVVFVCLAFSIPEVSVSSAQSISTVDTLLVAPTTFDIPDTYIDTNFVVPIIIRNTTELGAIAIPLTYAGHPELRIDATVVSTEGNIGVSYGAAGNHSSWMIRTSLVDHVGKGISIGFINFLAAFPPSSDTLVYVHFDLDSSGLSGVVHLDTGVVNGQHMSLTDTNALIIIPVWKSGLINIGTPPDLAAIGPQSVDEGANLNFVITATDPDLSVPALSAVGVPVNATFTDHGDGSGTFNFDPDFTQAGQFNVTFVASVGGLTNSEVVVITVTDINQAPLLSSIGPQSVDEGANLNILVTASDADGPAPTLSATGVPANATFADHSDGTGTFNFDPDFTQAGLFNVTIIASDGVLDDSEVVAIMVNDFNRAPILSAIGAKSVDENSNLNFLVSASDPDGPTPSLSATGVPGNATFVDHSDGTGTFNFDPDSTQAGVINVTLIASDGLLADSEVVTITVNNTNRVPVLAEIGPQGVSVFLNLSFTISATDPDGTVPSLTTSSLPGSAIFTDHGDGTGTFSWTPGCRDAGNYSVSFYASDGILTDSELVNIVVTEDFNWPPELAAIGPYNTDENVLLTFDVSASDSNCTTPLLSTANLPTGATFTDHGDGTGTYDWTPDVNQAGTYDVTFRATDGALTDSEVVAITVNNTDSAPVLATIGPRSVDEGANLNFVATATDPDSTTPTLSAVGVPVNATFTDHGDGSGTFNFDPDFTQAGTYDVTFIASDGALSDSEVVTITVNNTNRAPVLAEIGPLIAQELISFSVGISATDPDGTVPSLATSSLPGSADFMDHGDGTGTFSWTPGCITAGNYSVSFYASDGILTDSELVNIVVTEDFNWPPELAAIGPYDTDENVLLTFGISASDSNCTTPSLFAADLPTGATFTDHGDGTGTFDWTPTFMQAGIYNVPFHASDGSYIDTELVTITVNNVIQPDSTDSVQVGSVTALQGDQVIVPVYFENSQLLLEVTVPLLYSGDQVTADSVSFAGSRIEGQSVLTASIDALNQTIRIQAVPIDTIPIPLGSGLLANVYFSIAASAPVQTVVIDTTTLAGPTASLIYVNEGLTEYAPGFRSGVITIDAATSVGDDPVRPEGFALLQNYPNPFNPSTSLTYSLGESGVTRLDIYNTLGRHIITLVNRSQSAGVHTVTWHGIDSRGRSVPSGVYMARLTSANQMALMKMTFMK